MPADRDSDKARSGSITDLLKAWADGDERAAERLIPLVYDELRRLARRYTRREAGNHTLDTTALVNEAFLRLLDGKSIDWRSRMHFFAVSAQIMRRLLVDEARRRRSAKRSGGLQYTGLTPGGSSITPAELISLDDALRKLEKVDPRKVNVVELRFFAGLSVEETAEALKISLQTVRRDWQFARAWLMRELGWKS